MSKFYKTFHSALRKHPHIFNGITTFLLFAGSDAIAQSIEDKTRVYLPPCSNNMNKINNQDNILQKRGKENDFVVESIDHRRILSAGVIGIFFGIYFYPTAYSCLEKLFPGKKLITVMKKSIMEICTVGIFVNSVSIFLRGFSLGKGKDEVLRHMYHEIPNVTINDVKVWLPYNIIAFSIIPVYVRPTTTALMESGWQTYISSIANGYAENS